MKKDEYRMIGAIIVLYFPNQQLLERLLASASYQVDKFYFIDNTPNGCGFKVFNVNIVYHSLNENLGIAKAQNIGLNLAVEDGCDWFILLDQDSALSVGMIDALLEATITLEKDGSRVAAVGPLFCDEKTNLYSHAICHKGPIVRRITLHPEMEVPVESDYIISSGSLISKKSFDAIGLMYEELFIDWVDIEWGLRARSIGYKIYIIPNAVMKHCIGDSSVFVAGRHRNLHAHVRNYYIVRNATFLLRKKYMGWKWRIAVLFKIPQYVLFYAWHSHPRLKNLKSLCGAVIDGLRGKLGKWYQS